MPMKNRNHNRKFASPKRMEGESVVQNNLAVTPSQMYEMTKNGQPISTQMLNENLFFDGVPNPSWDLPMDLRRGVDVVDCWNASKDAKNKAKQGLARDIATYGQTPKTD